MRGKKRSRTFKSRSVIIFEYQFPVNGATQHYECRMVAVSDQLALGIGRNITQQMTAAEEKRRLLDQLQRAQKMEAIGMLAGGVAHDLNNIQSGLVSYPELILIDLPPQSPLQKPIRTIQRSGERAANIVQDLSSLARRGVSVSEGEAAIEPVRRQPVDIVLLDMIMDPGIYSGNCFHNTISTNVDNQEISTWFHRFCFYSICPLESHLIRMYTGTFICDGLNRFSYCLR